MVLHNWAVDLRTPLLDDGDADRPLPDEQPVNAEARTPSVAGKVIRDAMPVI